METMKTPSGYLKVLHVILGTIALGIVGYYTIYAANNPSSTVKVTGGVILANEVFFFLLVAYSCLFTSFLLLLSFFHEESALKIRKSSFEILYHLFSFIFYLAAAIALIVTVSKVPSSQRGGGPYVAAIIAILVALINSLLYAASAYVGFKAK